MRCGNPKDESGERQRLVLTSKIAKLQSKQEITQIGDGTQTTCIELLDKTHPCAPNHVAQQSMEGSEAVGDSGPQGNGPPSVQIVVEKTQSLVAARLQFPERHDANDPVHLGHQR
jgi:hypothetical protein